MAAGSLWTPAHYSSLATHANNTFRALLELSTEISVARIDRNLAEEGSNAELSLKRLITSMQHIMDFQHWQLDRIQQDFQEEITKICFPYGYASFQPAPNFAQVN